MSFEDSNYNTIQIRDLKKLPQSKLLEYLYKYDVEMNLLRSKIEEKSAQIEKMQSESNELKDQLGFIQKSNHILSLELHATNKRSEKYKEQLQSIQTEANRLKEELEEFNSNSPMNKKFKKELKSKGKAIESLKLDISDLQATIEFHKKDNSELKEQVLYLKEENVILKGKQEMVEIETLSISENLRSKNKILKDALKLAQQHLLGKKEKINELNEQVFKLETQNSTLQNELHQEIVKRKFNEKTMQDQKAKAEIWEKKFNDLEIRHNLQDKKNQKLTAMVRDMKMYDRHKNKKTYCNTDLSFVEVKSRVTDIYRSFIGEINKNIDGDTSVYQLESYNFSHIEKELNELICFLQEQIEEQESNCQPKDEKNLSQSYKKLISCVSPKLTLKRGSSCPRNFE